MTRARGGGGWGASPLQAPLWDIFPADGVPMNRGVRGGRVGVWQREDPRELAASRAGGAVGEKGTPSEVSLRGLSQVRAEERRAGGEQYGRPT